MGGVEGDGWLGDVEHGRGSLDAVLQRLRCLMIAGRPALRKRGDGSDCGGSPPPRRGAGGRGEQGRKTRRIAARHAALGADASHARVAPGGSKSRRISCAIVVLYETEIELSFGTELEALERRKISIIRAPLGHRQVEELDRS